MTANSNNGGGCSSNSEGKAKPHVVAVPHISPGHLIPFLELSKLLASQGLMVSYITTPWNVAHLQPQLDKMVAASNFEIDMKLVPVAVSSGQQGLIADHDSVPFRFTRTLLAGPLEEWLGRQLSIAPENAPICIISDVFTGWAHGIGAKFGVPTVVFQTSGAFAISVLHSCLTYAPYDKVERDDEYFEVPNLCFDLKLCRSDLPPMMRDPQMETVREAIKREIATSLEGRGVIFNTFSDLDAMGIHNIETLTGKPLWSIGPMLPDHVFHAAGVDRASGEVPRGKAADISEAECLQWLDCRSPSSVVFICFGSRAKLNREQIGALAWGLEASLQPFIWAIRRVEGVEPELPEGFQERTKDRGVVICGWAPQLLILSHPSVGCFFSHCGWNSTLESVSLGVPMIAWALSADQPFNSKLVVERLGMGTKLCVDSHGMPHREDVKRAVIMLLREEEGEIMRMRAKQLRTKAKMAVDEGGSSRKNLQSLVQYMRGLHHGADSKFNCNVNKASVAVRQRTPYSRR